MDEFIDVVKLPFAEALQMVYDNRLPDAKTQLAILKAAALLNKA
jgi:ADP-ribose pyrophosphatase